MSRRGRDRVKTSQLPTSNVPRFATWELAVGRWKSTRAQQQRSAGIDNGATRERDGKAPVHRNKDRQRGADDGEGAVGAPAPGNDIGAIGRDQAHAAGERDPWRDAVRRSKGARECV